MKLNFQNANSNDVVQTSAEYGAYSGEKQVKQVQRAALTIVTGAASAACGITSHAGDNWSKQVRAELESMTIHLVASMEGKRRTYSARDVYYAFMIGNALQIAEATLSTVIEYTKQQLTYKVNSPATAVQMIQELDSCRLQVRNLLDSFPVSPYIKDLIKMSGYYPGSKNHTPLVFAIDELGMQVGLYDDWDSANFESFYLTVDVAQEDDATRLRTQVGSLITAVTGLIRNTVREAAADLISYGKGSLRGIATSGKGQAYDRMRKLICNSVGGYGTDGFDAESNGTYKYDQIGVKWASVMVGFSQDHAALKDAVTSVVGEADGSGIDTAYLLGVPLGFFNLEESETTGTCAAEIVGLFFAKWTKHLSDQGQIWVWTNDRIDFDTWDDWDEASTNLPILLTNITSGLRDGFSLGYKIGSTGRRACYFSALADSEFTYYPIRLLDLAKDYQPELTNAFLHVDVAKLQAERKNNKNESKGAAKDKATKPSAGNNSNETAK